MITWEGFSDVDRDLAEEAIADVKMRLAELTGLAPDDAFHRLFGDITLEAMPEVAGAYHGYVSAIEPRRIQLEIGEITEALLKHELGHVLILTDPAEENIADVLSRTVIRTASGRAVTGAGRGGYCRHMGYKAKKYTGYHSINYPAHYHPVSFNDEAANSATEDFCDMFLAWASGNLADNEAGQAIREFVEGYLRSRLDNISRSVGGGGSVYTFGGKSTETLP